MTSSSQENMPSTEKNISESSNSPQYHNEQSNIISNIINHERDKNIRFKDEGHIYTLILGNKIIHPTSTTTFIHSMFPKFDSDAIIDKMLKSGSAQRKYPGLNKQQIKDLWNDNGKKSAELGTALHATIELFLNQNAFDNNKYKSQEQWLKDIEHEKKIFGTPANNQYLIKMGQQIIDCEQVKRTVGFKYFLDFWYDFLTKYSTCRIYRTEWLIYDEDALISGSIDGTVITPSGDLILIDWKRSKEIKYYNRYGKGLGLLSHMDDCNYNHYSLQLNIYRHILETKYNYKVIYMMLVVFHPNQKTYKCIPIKRMDDLINTLWAYRMEELKKTPIIPVDSLANKLNQVKL